MNNSPFHAAIVTSYRGYTFRSQAEAIFARNLELGDYQWVYEPTEGWPPGWAIDFCAWWPTERHPPVMEFVEFKPSRPTAAYVAFLTDRWRRSKWHGRPNACLVLAIGNPYEPDDERATFELCGEGWRRVESDLLDHLDDARRYRFDLAAPKMGWQ